MTTPLPLDHHLQSRRKARQAPSRTETLCGSFAYQGDLGAARRHIMAAILHGTANPALELRRFNLTESGNTGRCSYQVDGSAEAKAFFLAALQAAEEQLQI